MSDGPGIDLDLVARACADGDPDAMAELSLTLLSHVERRDRLMQDGNASLVRRGAALPDSLVNNWLYRMVKRCHLNGLAPPAELVSLLQRQLEQYRPPHNRPKTGSKKALACEYIAQHPEESTRSIGERFGVSHVVVAKWKKEVLSK